MKRIALMALIVALAACGGDSTGPSNRFTGTWTGIALPEGSDTLHFTFTPSQSGSDVTGTGIAEAGGSAEAFTYTGTSTSTTVTLVITLNAETLSYLGTYSTSKALTGVITEGPTSLELDLTKQ